jgi:hypothetical protein
MTGFLLSVWNDLRAKRLWPVALALALALVAVPVVLLKPAKQAPPPAASPGKPSPAASRTPVSAAVDTGASSLDRFSSKNPFRGAGKQGTAAAAGGATSAPAGSSSLAGSPATGSSGSSPSGGGSGSGSGSTGGSAPTQSPSAPQSGSPTKTTKYTYVVDLSFGRAGHLRRHHGFGKLGILPSQDHPLLVFVGVTDGGGNAAFLVDSTLIPQGEGRCKPSAKNCNFLYLGPGSEHRFTEPDGDVWTLRIDAIRKVSVKKARASKARARKANRVKAHTATGEPRAKRRFVPPLFVDLIETGGK